MADDERKLIDDPAAQLRVVWSPAPSGDPYTSGVVRIEPKRKGRKS